MKALKTLILLVTALAVTTAMVPQASSQTPPPAQQPPAAQQPPPAQPPPAEEQHNTHPVAKVRELVLHLEPPRGPLAGAGRLSYTLAVRITPAVRIAPAVRITRPNPIKPGNLGGRPSKT